MTATLPATLLTNHRVTPTEWAQILQAVAGITNLNFTRLFNPGVTTASASFVNLGALSISITKQFSSANSDMGVWLMTSQSTSTASSSTTYAVSDGTTDTTTHQVINLVTGLVYFGMGGAVLTGLAAGNYTFQARWKTSAGTATAGANGTFTLFVIELPK